jgi:hypothetical protein
LDPRLLNEGARPRTGKSSLHLHGSILEGKSIGSHQKMELKGKFMIWRIEMQAGPRQGPNQGFNLLQMSPNWFLGIWTLDPHIKWQTLNKIKLNVALSSTHL